MPGLSFWRNIRRDIITFQVVIQDNCLFKIRNRFDTTVDLSLSTEQVLCNAPHAAATSFLLLPHQFILTVRALPLTTQYSKQFSPLHVNGCSSQTLICYIQPIHHLIHNSLQKSGHSFLLRWKNYNAYWFITDFLSPEAQLHCSLTTLFLL